MRGKHIGDAALIVVLLLVLISLIPFWRSGRRGRMNFWGFLMNHTIWGPPTEYVPEEDYEKALEGR